MKCPLLVVHLRLRWLTVILATITSISALSAGAIAPVFASYVPPQTSSAPGQGSTSGGGVRGGGCSAASSAGLVPLAPQVHAGQTMSTQPTFAWFTPETESYTTEFRIVEYLPDGEFAMVYETEFDSTEKTLPSGITTVSLSETDVYLTPGKAYRWQAVLVCNPNRPSESLVAEANLVVVDAPADLDGRLATTVDASERSRLYAEASFWYDALREALNTAQAATQVSLLEDLAAIEESAEEPDDRSMAELSFGNRLRQVISLLQ